MLDLLLVLIFTGHLLLVDVALAGPLFCVWLDGRARRNGDATASAVGRRLAAFTFVATSLGIAAGLGLWLTIRQLPGQERYLRVLNAIPAARWWGIVSELAFYLMVIGVYWATWNRWRRWRWLHSALACVAVTTLAFHFPPLFATVSALSTRPELADKLADGEQFRTRYIFQDAETVARTVHHLLASLAVVGLIVAYNAARMEAEGGRESISPSRGLEASNDRTGEIDSRPPCSPPKQIGISATRIALVATLLQLPVGVWVFWQLPSPARDQMLGSDLLGTAIFVAALVTVLGLLHHLAALALGDCSSRKVLVAGLLLILTTLFMTGMLHRTRTDVYRQLDVLQKPNVHT